MDPGDCHFRTVASGPSSSEGEGIIDWMFADSNTSELSDMPMQRQAHWDTKETQKEGRSAELSSFIYRKRPSIEAIIFGPNYF